MLCTKNAFTKSSAHHDHSTQTVSGSSCATDQDQTNIYVQTALNHSRILHACLPAYVCMIEVSLLFLPSSHKTWGRSPASRLLARRSPALQPASAAEREAAIATHPPPLGVGLPPSSSDGRAAGGLASRRVGRQVQAGALPKGREPWLT